MDAKLRHRVGSLVLAALIGAFATIIFGVQPASAAPIVTAGGNLCTTEQWRNPTNFNMCVDKLQDLAADRVNCVKAPTPSAPDAERSRFRHGWLVRHAHARIRPERAEGAVRSVRLCRLQLHHI